MTDKDFKKLEHSYKRGFQSHQWDNDSAKKFGYRPDVVLRKNDDYIILESETGTSRKNFLGDVCKAAFFLREERKGQLVIVMKTHNNTKIESIRANLSLYFEWITQNSNLQCVWLIEHKKYLKVKAPLVIGGAEFKENAFKISRSRQFARYSTK